ncbi:hypothetical protein IG631_18725 [Alternaria alternata]|nr:hypothetical protein IG631_18725 [Alternaria alternata]
MRNHRVSKERNVDGQIRSALCSVQPQCGNGRLTTSALALDIYMVLIDGKILHGLMLIKPSCPLRGVRLEAAIFLVPDKEVSQTVHDVFVVAFGP